MKILVTGAVGQVAQSLVEVSTGGSVLVEAHGRPLLDITDAGSVRARLRESGADVVVNAAAFTAVDKAESDAEAARQVNAVGAGHVAAACQAAGIPVIHISTDYVYDGTKPAPYVESDATGPDSVYGKTKLAGEVAVAAACARHVILRTAWVHSPFGNNFVKTMLRLAATRDELGVVDDQRGSPTYAPHLAGAILQIAEHVVGAGDDAGFWGVYHAAGRGETTWCGLAGAIFECSAKSGGPTAAVKAIATSDYPTPARRPPNSRLSCDKMRRVFGIALPDWRDGVDACVRRLVPLA